MKSIEKIKNEVAVKHGYKDWLELCHHYQYVEFSHDEFNGYLNEVATEYAKQRCDEQIERCTEEFEKDDSLSLCSTSAILNTPNVVTTKP